ncbi:MAG: response regulator [Acidimicrobiales bacterium]
MSIDPTMQPDAAGTPAVAGAARSAGEGPIRVVVVDDHHVVRAGLEQLLGTAPGIELVGMAADGLEAMQLVAALSPDVVLMDLSMPNLDGVGATRQLMDAHPELRVVVLTSFSDQRRILDALDAGASGYLLKHASAEELFDAIRAAALGGAPLDPMAARVLLNANRDRRVDNQLSDREQEVLHLVSQGLANKHIARRLGITERTVKAHLTHIFQRIGVTDRTQAALWARDHLARPPG